jgi:predicted O-linked N-acetylglucosamine transferase (SPINDLY family)
VEILRVDPRAAGALHVLGGVCAGEGDFITAEQRLSLAVALDPVNASWLRDLAAVRVAAQDLSGALQAVLRSLAIDPAHPAALRLHALVLQEAGRIEAAVEAFDCWAAAEPGELEAWLGSARCLLELNRPSAAGARARCALQIAPDSVRAHQLLANAYFNAFEPGNALIQCLEIVRLLPGEPSALAVLAMAYHNLGDTDRAVDLFRTVGSARLSATLHAAYLSVLLHYAGATGQLLAEEHQAWVSRHGGPSLTEPAITTVSAAGRRMRVGYICTEPKSSPVFHFLSPLLRNHNRDAFDVKLYCQDPGLVGSAAVAGVEEGELKDVTGWPESQIARQIREDAVDVLVYPSGHFAGRSLVVATMRAAPLQVAFPSYPSTTGVPDMDYIFTDRWTCERGQENQYTEKPYWLDSGYLVYGPPKGARLDKELPAFRNGFVTFGLFQRPAKLNRWVWDAIAQVLKQVEKSHLFVHHSSTELDVSSSESRRMLIAALETRAVDPARVNFRGFVSRSVHLRLVSSVDLALDTFPYTGQTTTCECLWMGVPVVTLAGRTHVSRVSAALLNRLGLANMVTVDSERYVRQAVGTAQDLAALQALRQDLRNRFRSSTLFDGARLASEIEKAYHWMWEQSRNVRSAFTG